MTALLITHAHGTLERYGHPLLGRLVQPRHYSRIADTARAGITWAADNDAFNGWTPEAEQRFERMLGALEGLPGCRFVTAPDVVGDAGLTDLLFEEWAPRILAHRLPVAYVVQEHGCEYEPRGVPWGPISALFVGCVDDRVKLGRGVEQLVRDAQARGKWTHMGRVNTAKRLAYVRALGFDSCDGSKWARWPDTHLPTAVTLLDRPVQLRLEAA